MKQDVQGEIVYYLRKLPKFERPIQVHFIWQSEKSDRRDLDNICFAKKFILDAMQQASRLTNDNRNYVTGFTDEFTYGDKYAVILEIEEQTNEEIFTSRGEVCSTKPKQAITTGNS